jgi:hypothetical protein
MPQKKSAPKPKPKPKQEKPKQEKPKPKPKGGGRKASGGAMVYSLPTPGSFQDSVVSTIGDVTALNVPYINHARYLADTAPNSGQFSDAAPDFAPLMGVTDSGVAGGMPRRKPAAKKPAAKKPAPGAKPKKTSRSRGSSGMSGGACGCSQSGL